ncbi:hypothetical protein COCC4DRAFT_57557 [Bipolaris maydis ATCC 48331]|uniref:Linalool dehydratase/isomerase domain-containing protein n=2 Tax=Cochliobolus heterostrophus TaxID=5016 RepID=M2UU73_COCH5|nr:uncharacterized protein COCC4DRAFT_57557 [Bipolaris maydis ATCC 48331]EMD91412.1 hypothetical protein COCHEDRAFT_1030240 [Bipolaris maydis C5]ENI08831.1 hypothetical protein COCC4DRAFT_57557 [Bipolaris maydis ATCC 48331]
MEALDPASSLHAVASDTLLIPSCAGAQKVTTRYQRRTQAQYLLLFVAGLLGFYKSQSNFIRVLSLSCIFPGTGFLAVGGIIGATGFVLTLLVLPLSLFAWFGAGGLVFVLANWIVPGIAAAAVVGDSVANQPMDDWANFTRIDQFQTSALRYQLYDVQYTLAAVQKFYMPNFHGYIKAAQENVIEKSTTKDVMNYWKWESLWGKFTLPNWIYSACNLIGMEGAIAYDSYQKTGRVATLLDGDYQRGFEEDFTDPDGSIVPLRSAITGFSIPGLAGVLGDAGSALHCSAGMPHIARRLWHLSRASVVRKDEKGRFMLENLGMLNITAS